MSEPVPVITIDGPSGSGKGTVSSRVAEALGGWHFLDSGALYRLTGLAVERAGIGFEDPQKAAEIAAHLDVRFDQDKVFLDGEDVTLAIRTEEAGNRASKVAAMPEVRAALLDWQRQAARPPGLVADGRDMGTTVFPDALLKVFLTASAEERARRRYKQLKEKGISSNIEKLAGEIRERDERDRSRSASPLVPAADALVIDSSDMTIDEVVERIVQAAQKALPAG
ncbi:MAG: (d)CMP kinase [Gammaproteobacteria bacterium]|nr:MAG: (d)CMP kinase [Gammaproteobacteria bacterium]